MTVTKLDRHTRLRISRLGVGLLGILGIAMMALGISVQTARDATRGIEAQQAQLMRQQDAQAKEQKRLDDILSGRVALNAARVSADGETVAQLAADVAAEQAAITALQADVATVKARLAADESINRSGVGPAGATGPPGPRGAVGPQGPPGIPGNNGKAAKVSNSGLCLLNC